MTNRKAGIRLFCAVVLSGALALGWAQSGPENRTATDPHSVVSPSNPAASPVPIDDLFYTRATLSPSWSPDGREVAFTTNLTGRLNLWKVNAAGGWPMQVIQSDDRQLLATWSPDGKWIVYQQDHGGNELYDLFAVPSSGGAAVNLTNSNDASEEFPLFSHSGRLLALTYKLKTGSVRDVAVMDWATHQVRNLTREQTKDHSWQLAAWSPDEKFLYATRANATFTDADIYRIDVGSGATEKLTPSRSAQVLYTVNDASHDGKWLLITSNEKYGAANVALLELATRKIRFVSDTRWEADGGDFAPDSKTFSYTINSD